MSDTPRLWKELQDSWEQHNFPLQECLNQMTNLAEALQDERDRAQRQNAELLEALKAAANELDLLYAFAINHGVPEAGIPPQRAARAAIAKAES